MYQQHKVKGGSMAKHAVLHSFYCSEKWRSFRLGLISERGNKCERCGKIVSKSIDLHAHHMVELTPENVHDKLISLNPSKIELICRTCHDEEHNRFSRKKEKKVYLVYGAPLSGKSTHVMEHMQRGDIIVDMNRLYESITGLPEYDKPDQLLQVVLGLHNKLIDNIKTRYGKWNTAWVIGGYADKFKRERLANELGAELIFCDISKEECLHRLELDEKLQYRKKEWADYINEWFERFIK